MSPFFRQEQMTPAPAAQPTQIPFWTPNFFTGALGAAQGGLQGIGSYQSAMSQGPAMDAGFYPGQEHQERQDYARRAGRDAAISLLAGSLFALPTGGASAAIGPALAAGGTLAGSSKVAGTGPTMGSFGKALGAGAAAGLGAHIAAPIYGLAKLGSRLF